MTGPGEDELGHKFDDGAARVSAGSRILGDEQRSYGVWPMTNGLVPSVLWTDDFIAARGRRGGGCVGSSGGVDRRKGVGRRRENKMVFCSATAERDCRRYRASVKAGNCFLSSRRDRAGRGDPTRRIFHGTRAIRRSSFARPISRDSFLRLSSGIYLALASAPFSSLRGR